MKSNRVPGVDFSPVRGGFIDEAKSFVENHKVLCIGTLGLAVIGYSIKNLAGRAVSQIGECKGITKNIDILTHETFTNLPNRQGTQNGIASELLVTKEIDSIPRGNSDLLTVFKVKESPSSLINWLDASLQIRTQVKEMWPKSTERFTSRVPAGDRIVCSTEGNKLVGCVSLKRFTITEPASLVQEIGSHKVYELSIQIHDDYQGKGYGRILFNNVCNLVFEEGALIFINRARAKGDQLYGGEKTRALFDVYHVLRGERGEYLLKTKTQKNNNLNYLKIDPNDVDIFNAIETPEGINLLANYLQVHPEDVNLIDSSIMRHCESVIKICQNTWNEEQLTKYNEGLSSLRTTFHESL